MPEPVELPRTIRRRRSASRSSIAFFSSFSVGVEGGLTEDMGYTVAIWGRMKCALFKGLEFSLASGTVWLGVGRNLVKREKRDCGAGAGGLRIDFPGIGMVTAEEDGEHDAAMNSNNADGSYRERRN